MMKKIMLGILALIALRPLEAAPALDSPLWQSWEDTPMVREWKNLVAKEAWRGNTIGIDHWVPPPWTPVEEKKDSIEVWGRQYCFDGKALPIQLTSQSNLILTEAARFKALIGGTWYTSSPGSGKVMEIFPDKAVYEGRTEVAGIEISSKFTIEFDGFAWGEFNLGGAPEERKVERLALEFPVRRDVAQFYRKQSEGLTQKAVRDRWGKITDSRELGPLMPYYATDFCVANDQIGIEFCLEGVSGWLCTSFHRRVEWVVEDTSVLLRFNFIDAPPEGKVSPTRVELGFNLMPYRPLDRQRMANFIYSWDAEGWAYDEIVRSPSPAVRIVSGYFWGLDEVAKKPNLSDSCMPADISMPRNPERFLNFMKKLRSDKPGTQIVNYTVGDLHNDYDPVFIDQSDKWKGATDKLDTATVYAEICKKRGELRRVCGWNQDFNDYKVFCLTYWAEKLGLDGFYWDDQSYTACVNPDHKEHHFLDCNGDRLLKKPIRPYREMAKRIYKTLKKRNPNSVFIGHGFPPYAPFSDMVIDGEVLRKLSGDKQYYTRFIEPEDYRNVFFNSHVDGSAKSLLPEYSGRFYTGSEAPRATRALLSFLWMTDMSVWIHGSSGRVLLHSFIHPRGAFGVHQAEYLPAHRQNLATVDADKVYCTVFRKKDKALIVVSNLGQATVKDTLNLDLSNLFDSRSTGFLYNLKAYDGEKHTQVTMSLVPAQAACFAEINVEVPAEDFLLFEIK